LCRVADPIGEQHTLCVQPQHSGAADPFSLTLQRRERIADAALSDHCRCERDRCADPQLRLGRQHQRALEIADRLRVGAVAELRFAKSDEDGGEIGAGRRLGQCPAQHRARGLHCAAGERAIARGAQRRGHLLVPARRREHQMVRDLLDRCRGCLQCGCSCRVQRLATVGPDVAIDRRSDNGVNKVDRVA
jgi:hypothetical protein